MSYLGYIVKWGFEGEGSDEQCEEGDLHDAVDVARANGGVIFDRNGHQLSQTEIEALLHPLRAVAEEIVNKLTMGLNGHQGRNLEIHAPHLGRVGTWSAESAIVAIEKVLEGSGLA